MVDQGAAGIIDEGGILPTVHDKTTAGIGNGAEVNQAVTQSIKQREGPFVDDLSVELIDQGVVVGRINLKGTFIGKNTLVDKTIRIAADYV
ncbi:MAG: hypothetical protein KIPDCIKN_00398 [Haliscomenobacter sp.]|nr:hypothetical protein [Haliscomenobacter sp.]